MKLQEKMGELKRCFKGRNRQELDLEDEDKIKDLEMFVLCFSIPFMLEEEIV